MIKTIIFDFGDVFINLDKKGTIKKSKELLGLDIISENKNADNKIIFDANNDYEKGYISTEEFIDFYSKLDKNISKKQIVELWNSLIKDFPKHRLEFIKQLKAENKFNLILLSNTNELHIEQVIKNMTLERYNDFKSCFHKFYLSHEIHLRKPNVDVFKFILNKNNLKAEECFFIDDTKQNIEAAKKTGIHCWNIDEQTQDVTTLFKTFKHLF